MDIINICVHKYISVSIYILHILKRQLNTKSFIPFRVKKSQRTHSYLANSLVWEIYINWLFCEFIILFLSEVRKNCFQSPLLSVLKSHLKPDRAHFWISRAPAFSASHLVLSTCRVCVCGGAHTHTHAEKEIILCLRKARKSRQWTDTPQAPSSKCCCHCYCYCSDGGGLQGLDLLGFSECVYFSLSLSLPLFFSLSFSLPLSLIHTLPIYKYFIGKIFKLL